MYWKPARRPSWCVPWQPFLPLLLVAVGAAADWPQFKRDAARSGNAPEETLALPLKHILAVRFPSPIYASPAVVDGRVYVQDAHGHLACVVAAEKNGSSEESVGKLRAVCGVGGQVF